jgi:hypothetical protein
MKALATVLALAACSLWLAGCGGEESDCEKADDIRATAFNEVCAAKGDDCCICKCWNDGNQEMDTEIPCTCKPQPGGDCTGDLKTAAKTCLAAPEPCRQGVKDQIEMACPALP